MYIYIYGLKKNSLRPKSAILRVFDSTELKFSPCGAKEGVFVRISASSFLPVQN